MNTKFPLGQTNTPSEGLEHAEASYKNAQDIIRLVDTKTSVLTGLIVITTAFSISLLNWCLQKDNGSLVHNIFTAYPRLVRFGFAVVGLAIVAGGIALLFAMASIVPRRPSNGHTVLFPIHNEEGKLEFENLLLKLKGGFSREDRLAEYTKQIQDVGLIMYQKLHRQRWAIKVFQTQIFLLIYAAVIVSWIAAVC